MPSVEECPTWLPVVAACLCDRDGRWLMHRRPSHKQHGGLWEFPGGKVEDGENPRFALVRELKEELGIEVAVSDIAPSLFADDVVAVSEGGMRTPIVLFLYTVRNWVGDPTPLEGGALEWFAPLEASALATPPLDRELLDQLAGAVE